MLRDIVEKNHYCFIDKADNWQDAIRKSCGPLEADGTVEPVYADQIIECVAKYGPYIVLMPGVAMPHSQEDAKGVHKTAISFMKVKQPVPFDENDPELNASLFFTFSSCNHEEHLENMQRLSELLMNEALVEELFKAESADDLLKINEKYL